MKDGDLKKNASGYSDPTAYKAIKKVDKDIDRYHKLLNTIFNICQLSGFKIEGRIVLIDRKTGKIWK